MNPEGFIFMKYLENRITCIKQTQKKNEIEIKTKRVLKICRRVIYDFNRENQKLFIEKINNESTQRVCTLQVK